MAVIYAEGSPASLTKSRVLAEFAEKEMARARLRAALALDDARFGREDAATGAPPPGRVPEVRGRPWCTREQARERGLTHEWHRYATMVLDTTDADRFIGGVWRRETADEVFVRVWAHLVSLWRIATADEQHETLKREAIAQLVPLLDELGLPTLDYLVERLIKDPDAEPYVVAWLCPTTLRKCIPIVPSSSESMYGPFEMSDPRSLVADFVQRKRLLDELYRNGASFPDPPPPDPPAVVGYVVPVRSGDVMAAVADAVLARLVHEQNLRHGDDYRFAGGVPTFTID
jgi:hypothetical protein